jgi:hypothetical protein
MTVQISHPGSHVRVPLFIDEMTARREVILAEAAPLPNVFVAQSIPAFIYGLALGDHFCLINAEHGDFKLVKRSGQVTIRGYIEGTLDRPGVTKVIDETTEIGGTYETARNAVDGTGTSLLLLSLHVSHGFPKIESLLSNLPARGCNWEYGNVYDGEGSPLNWWPAT